MRQQPLVKAVSSGYIITCIFACTNRFYLSHLFGQLMHFECTYSLPSINAVPMYFGVLHNATSYYVSFRPDLSLGSIVLNYTIYINLTNVGNPLGIYLTLSGSRVINNIFSFDNSLRTNDYIFGINTPPTYTVDNNIATFEESILYRNEVPESLFAGDVASFDFELSSEVAGSTLSIFQDNAVVFVTATRTPGKIMNNLITNSTLLS